MGRIFSEVEFRAVFSPPMKPCSPQLEENQIGTHTHKIPLAYFAVSFQLLFQPFKVSVASPYRRLLYLEYGDVCLHVYIHKVSVFGEVGIVTKLSSRKLEIKKLYSIKFILAPFSSTGNLCGPQMGGRALRLLINQF